MVVILAVWFEEQPRIRSASPQQSIAFTLINTRLTAPAFFWYHEYSTYFCDSPEKIFLVSGLCIDAGDASGSADDDDQVNCFEGNFPRFHHFLTVTSLMITRIIASFTVVTTMTHDPCLQMIIGNKCKVIYNGMMRWSCIELIRAIHLWWRWRRHWRHSK